MPRRVSQIFKQCIGDKLLSCLVWVNVISIRILAVFYRLAKEWF